MSRSRPRRGQPLVALATLLVGWVGLRLAGFGDAEEEQIAAAAPRRPAEPMALAASVMEKPALPQTRHLRGLPHKIRLPQPLAPQTEALAPPDESFSSLAPVPEAGPEPFTGPGATEPHRDRRWSGDAWLLGRGDAPGAVSGPFYGASQVGAVLRYRLIPRSPLRPTLYLRGAAALDPAPEQDAALGVAFRPVSRLPLAIGVECRMTRNRYASRLHPALVAVAGLPPRSLPGGFTAELYAQGGWIGGPRPEAFGDLQVRAERVVRGTAGWQARLGGGLWAAGQRGAGRIDLGPVASLSGPLASGATVRFELDWRLRAAGNAAPGSGPALVVATSF